MIGLPLLPECSSCELAFPAFRLLVSCPGDLLSLAEAHRCPGSLSIHTPIPQLSTLRFLTLPLLEAQLREHTQAPGVLGVLGKMTILAEAGSVDSQLVTISKMPQTSRGLQ